MIQPGTIRIVRSDDYSGEHREWTQEFVLPASAVEQLLEQAIENMGWPEIHAYHEALRRGQDYREDAGGFMLRCIKALFGLSPRTKDEIVTHQEALSALLQKAREA